MSQQSLLGALALDFAVQWVAWAVAALLQTEKFYDLTGSLTFVALSVSSLLHGPATLTPRARLMTGLVCVWAARLGTYLVTRIAKDGHDSRFDRVRDKPSRFFVFWTIQGVWCFVTSLPVLLVNGQATQAPLWSITDVLGCALWCMGFLIETVADWQKSSWKSRPENKGKFIDTGLWSLARHPNYGGEMLVWWGAAIIALAGLAGSPGTQAAALCSPVFVSFLLTRVSGVPMLHRAAEKRWGKQAAYKVYKSRTQGVRLLFPFPRV